MEISSNFVAFSEYTYELYSEKKIEDYYCASSIYRVDRQCCGISTLSTLLYVSSKYGEDNHGAVVCFEKLHAINPDPLFFLPNSLIICLPLHVKF